MKSTYLKSLMLLFAVVLTAFVSTAYAQNVSDTEIKTNVVGISNALAKLKQLEPVTYEYNTHKYKQLDLAEGKKYGFLSENIQAVFPEMVQNRHIPYMASKNSYKDLVVKKMDTESLIPVLVASIKELETEIVKLKAELIHIKGAK